MDMLQHWAVLEAGFGELLTALDSTITAEQTRPIREFVAANEYGLALEEAICALAESELRPSARAVAIISDLAARMEIADTPIVRDFRDRSVATGAG